MEECFIRGNTVKYMRLPDEVIDLQIKAANEYAQRKAAQMERRGRGRG